MSVRCGRLGEGNRQKTDWIHAEKEKKKHASMGSTVRLKNVCGCVSVRVELPFCFCNIQLYDLILTADFFLSLSSSCTTRPWQLTFLVSQSSSCMTRPWQLTFFLSLSSSCMIRHWKLTTISLSCHPVVWLDLGSWHPSIVHFMTKPWPLTSSVIRLYD